MKACFFSALSRIASRRRDASSADVPTPPWHRAPGCLGMDVVFPSERNREVSRMPRSWFHEPSLHASASKDVVHGSFRRVHLRFGFGKSHLMGWIPSGNNRSSTSINRKKSSVASSPCIRWPVFMRWWWCWDPFLSVSSMDVWIRCALDSIRSRGSNPPACLSLPPCASLPVSLTLSEDVPRGSRLKTISKGRMETEMLEGVETLVVRRPLADREERDQGRSWESAIVFDTARPSFLLGIARKAFRTRIRKVSDPSLRSISLVSTHESTRKGRAWNSPRWRRCRLDAGTRRRLLRGSAEERSVARDAEAPPSLDIEAFP